MISVPNHLPRLSGSKLIAFFLVLFIFASCGGTDKALKKTRTRKTTPRGSTTTKSTGKKKRKVKEVEWKEAKDDKKPPITASKNTKSSNNGSISIEKEDSYDVTCFIPFDARNFTAERSSERFVQYYAGMQIASKILEKEGVNLNINVVDEKKSRFENLLPQFVTSQTDVIVGPYNRSNLKAAARFAKKNEIPLVSPWQASSKISKDNPYYVQLRPGLNEHYYAIFEDIKKNFGDAEKVTLIGSITSPKDGKRIKKLQRMASDVWGKESNELIQKYMTVPDSIDIGVTAFDSLFVQGENNIVVIPNWSFDDEDYIYGALRRMSVEKGMAKITVYGMPIMMESEKINFDYYNSLNMRVARSKFVDERDSDVQRFKRDFVSLYGALPTDDAYEGYDNLMYIGRNITKYGKQFQHYLHKDDGYYLQARYNVKPKYDDSPSDRKKPVEYFENSNIDIIEFKNNIFVRKIN